MSSRKTHVKKIAITGGIGSGKSTLSRALSDLGYPVYDADRLVARVVLSQSVRAQIENLFGATAYTHMSDGTESYNRAWVREQILQDEALRKQLEAIIHPALAAEFDSICESLEALAGGVWVFYEAALIFEANRESSFNAVVSVLADEDVRRARLRSSRSLTDSEISAIFAAQVSDHVRRSKSQFIIENSGSAESLSGFALELLADLRQFFHPKSA